MHLFCKDKYRLELHWDELEYQTDSRVLLKGAKFSGPVLTQALKLEAPDFIDLDLTPQMLTVMDSYYIIKLDWAACEYLPDGTIKLLDATLSNAFLKSLHKLQQHDFIAINTAKHEEETHAFNLVYESQVVKKDSTPYDYKDK
jgi:hypothetical protein